MAISMKFEVAWRLVSNGFVRVSFSLLMLLALGVPSSTQVSTEPIVATVCDVLSKPSAFNGKMVRLSGTVDISFEYLALSQGTCRAIWLDLPGVDPVHPDPSFQMLRDDNLAQFMKLLATRKTADVVLLGRLDGVDEIQQGQTVREERKHKDGSESAVVGFHSNGFGHMGQYKARLVLQRVVAVQTSPATAN
jgi:hypothetical protein